MNRRRQEASPEEIELGLNTFFGTPFETNLRERCNSHFPMMFPSEHDSLRGNQMVARTITVFLKECAWFAIEDWDGLLERCLRDAYAHQYHDIRFERDLAGFLYLAAPGTMGTDPAPAPDKMGAVLTRRCRTILKKKNISLSGAADVDEVIGGAYFEFLAVARRYDVKHWPGLLVNCLSFATFRLYKRREKPVTYESSAQAPRPGTFQIESFEEQLADRSDRVLDFTGQVSPTPEDLVVPNHPDHLGLLESYCHLEDLGRCLHAERCLDLRAQGSRDLCLLRKALNGDGNNKGAERLAGDYKTRVSRMLTSVRSALFERLLDTSGILESNPVLSYILSVDASKELIFYQNLKEHGLPPDKVRRELTAFDAWLRQSKWDDRATPFSCHPAFEALPDIDKKTSRFVAVLRTKQLESAFRRQILRPSPETCHFMIFYEGLGSEETARQVP